MAVAGLTLAGFLLRLAGVDESLFGDELFAYDEVNGHSLGEVLRNVTEGEENSPPLYFALAWAATKLGDPTVLIRAPSLVLGSATIPIVYLVGQRTVSRAVGLVAAALTALSPLAVYFSVEARPYGTLMFLLALSTLALLLALETPRRRWWLLYWAAAAAALYTHYTAVAVLAVQGVWALWAYPTRSREVLLANLAVGLAFLPWVPRFAEQRRGAQDLDITGSLFPLTFGSFAETTSKLVPGYERAGLAEVPGVPALSLFGAAVVVALAGVLVRARTGARWRRPPPKVVLVVGLALAAPACLLIYSLLGEDLYTPRHLLASLPAVAILLAALFAALPRPLAVATTLAALLALTIGLTRSFDPDRDRPPLKQAARFIDARAGPGDPVLEIVFLGYRGLFTRHLAINFERHHPLYQIGFVIPTPGLAEGLGAASRVFVVGPWGGPPYWSPLPPYIASRFRLANAHVWRGTDHVAVLELVLKRPGAGRS